MLMRMQKAERNSEYKCSPSGARRITISSQKFSVSPHGLLCIEDGDPDYKLDTLEFINELMEQTLLAACFKKILCVLSVSIK